MILSELMDKLGIPSQAKDIMADKVLNSEVLIKHEDGRYAGRLTGEVGVAYGSNYREIIIWVEA